jgi:hypothetical protein
VWVFHVFKLPCFLNVRDYNRIVPKYRRHLPSFLCSVKLLWLTRPMWQHRFVVILNRGSLSFTYLTDEVHSSESFFITNSSSANQEIYQCHMKFRHRVHNSPPRVSILRQTNTSTIPHSFSQRQLLIPSSYPCLGPTNGLFPVFPTTTQYAPLLYPICVTWTALSQSSYFDHTNNF